MHLLLLSTFVCASLLAYPSLTSPVSPLSDGTKTRRFSVISPGSTNSSLGFWPPEGPRTFQCSVVGVSHLEIVPKDTFLMVIAMLEQVAQADFNGLLDRATESWTGSNGLIIKASSINAQPMYRRFVMWAIIRIMITMKEEPRIGYHAGFFELSWFGIKVGTIAVGYRRPPPPPTGQLSIDNATKSESPLTTPRNVSTTSVMLGDDTLAWIYTPGGHLMTEWDVAMGTIGALVEAADHSNHEFNAFEGGLLPNARATCLYETTIHPSRFSKIILIRTLAQAAMWALNDGDYHELRVRVLDNARDIAYGGYRWAGPRLSASSNSTVVASF